MVENKKSEFTVTDRRRFTSEGEPTGQAQPREQASPKPAEPPKPAAPEPPMAEPPIPEGAPDPRTAPPPSAAEQKAQHEAFKASAKQLDDQIRSHLGARREQEFEISFERYIVSLYVSALLHLGLMQEQGGTPQVDLLAARQTIDTLGLLADKTKGNLTTTEENLLQNCLYELRMAYVEVTNAFARAPQGPGTPPPGGPNVK
jgi:hypothetical protein